MSAIKQLTEHQAKNLLIFAKALKWMAWGFIAFGGLLTITIVVAPLGIPTVILGVVLLFVSKYLAKQLVVFNRAASEAVEIIDHNLQKARSHKTEDSERG